MRKMIMIILAAAMFLAVAVAEVSAQGVLMNSAETINQGNLKLGIFPTILFGKNGGDSVWGVAGRFGYGLTSNIDIEAKAAFFKGLKYFGADVEYWFLKGGNFNASAALGGHITDYNGGGDSKPASTPRFWPAPDPQRTWRSTVASCSPSIRSKIRISTTPWCISCRGSSTASATTSISWPRSASPSMTTPAVMAAWDWHCTFCAEDSSQEAAGALFRTGEGKSSSSHGAANRSPQLFFFFGNEAGRG